MIVTRREIEERAEQAERLRTDPVFQRAIGEARKRRVEALIAARPDDAETIRTIQADIKAIDGLCNEIANEILRAKPQRAVAVA
jgi:hypothetical protein